MTRARPASCAPVFACVFACASMCAAALEARGDDGIRAAQEAMKSPTVADEPCDVECPDRVAPAPDASADAPPSTLSTPPPTPSAVDAPTLAEHDAALDRLDAIERRLARVEAENARLRAKETAAPHLLVGAGLRLIPRGFVDAGAFYAFGDGTAYVRDVDRSEIRALESFPFLLPILADRPRPTADDAAWIFFGDPWANAVNTQGDPAHLGSDRSVVHRFDPIAKKGGFSLIVNSVGVGLIGTMGSSLSFETLFLVEPRAGALGAPGDVFSLPLAYLDWRPFESADLHLYVGKLTSTFGREYREQFAPERFGVTPSIIARYTSGNPVGGKARWRAFDGLFTVAGSLTNGGMSTERFGLFAEDVDTNTLPTGTARVSSEVGLDLFDRPFRGEVGLSVLVGVMDDQLELTRLAHQIGVDLHVELDDLWIDGEYVRGEAPRAVNGDGPYLSFDGFALTTTLRATGLVGVIARVDARRAILLTEPNLYVSDVARFTVGLRFDLSYHLVWKFEAIHVQELSGPEIPDDVLTTSLLLRF